MTRLFAFPLVAALAGWATVASSCVPNETAKPASASGARGGAGGGTSSGTGGGGGTSTAPSTGGAPGGSAQGGTSAPAATDAASTNPEVAPDHQVSGDVMTGGEPGRADGPAPLAGLVKIMVIGSSNETDTCWRAFLWQKLRAAGVTNFDFVGTKNVGPDCGVPNYDKDAEAQGGTIFASISANDFATRFKANPPHVVLVHVAGADARNGTPIPTILKAYSLAVEQARLVNPQVIFFVGQHTPQQPPTGIAELNAALPGWAAQISTPQSFVGVVDLFSIINPEMDQPDRTHLNISGSQKVSDAWLKVLLPLLKP